MNRLLTAALFSLILLAPASTAAERRLLAYYSSRSPSYNAANIPFHQLTHLDHAFVRLAAAGDGTLTTGPNFLEPELIQRAHAAGVKVMISLNGNARLFGKVAASPAALANLVKNLGDFVTANGYDGVDVDWEYPDGLEERAGCTLFMLALRKQLPAPQYLISMATTADPRKRGQGSYDLSALAEVVDFFNVMTYDFHGPWSNHAGHNSPLFPNPLDPSHDHIGLKEAIDVYVDYFHIPAEKLNIGTAFYGYEFSTARDLFDKCDCRPTTSARGYGDYIKPRINGMGWVRRFDEAAQAPYLVRESRAEPGFITYDDPESTARKLDYALGQRGAGGFFTWSIGGRYSDYDGQSEDLMTAMYQAFAKYKAAPAPDWGKPVWNDEFDSTVQGAPPDSTKWVFDVGAGKWGNRELETYCDSAPSTPAPCDSKNPNVFQDGQGHLVIQAVRSSPDPAPTGAWTSGRIKTRGIHEFTYGRMEACMQLPTGAGLWPAFWLLGTVGDGFKGEIDIMENVPKSGQPGGLGPDIVETTIHGARPDGPGRLFSLAADVTLPFGARIDDTNPPCHIYGAIWSPFMIQVYVDDWRSPFFIRTAADVPEGGKWVFNAPNRFYFLMNVAVGGQWPGPPNGTTPSPGRMLVDYVRVYQSPPVAAPAMSAQSGTITLTHGSNRVYLACSGAPAGAACTVVTGNKVNTSVVDFSQGETEHATVSLKSAPPGSYSLTVTAYSISGEQSTVTVPVVVN